MPPHPRNFSGLNVSYPLDLVKLHGSILMCLSGGEMVYGLSRSKSQKKCRLPFDRMTKRHFYAFAHLRICSLPASGVFFRSVSSGVFVKAVK